MDYLIDSSQQQQQQQQFTKKYIYIYPSTKQTLTPFILWIQKLNHLHQDECLTKYFRVYWYVMSFSKPHYYEEKGWMRYRCKLQQGLGFIKEIDHKIWKKHYKGGVSNHPIDIVPSNWVIMV